MFTVGSCMRHGGAWIVGVIVLIGLGACGDAPAARPASSSPATLVTPASLRGGEPVPPPADKVVLTVSGRISEHNQGRSLAWDLPGLDRLGITEVTVFDPWAKKSVTLRGVWLADLLKVAQARPASGLDLTALDDYKVHLSADEVAAGGILLATRTGDGGDIAVEDGGPTRIVYADGVSAGKNPDQWIWSLKTLAVT